MQIFRPLWFDKGVDRKGTRAAGHHRDVFGGWDAATKAHFGILDQALLEAPARRAQAIRQEVRNTALSLSTAIRQLRPGLEEEKLPEARPK